ncbi:hypothetical protein C7437_101523 [Psychrobacillus insolitus]|uniref:Zinc-ribbon domain-containing protein n=1 Tax=Psychrobacillus insolitus TaxID=1461 RepID=A0A2W7MKZ4_9BACI|nr:hypothetical protein [Psychrobacillus insolitus]PZX07410.1 hypothetical protein C7437_101523 [Psychrobacillus insolitus]
MDKKNNKELMSLMWDKQKNKNLLNLEFSDVTTKDNKSMTYWICHFEGRSCSFRKTPNQVYKALYQGSAKCNVCHELPFEKSIMFKKPDRVAKYWNHLKNSEINVFPEYTTPYSNKYVYVHCEKHDWQGKQGCSDLIDHNPCPYCSGKSATADYNLQVIFPEIAKTLHPESMLIECLFLLPVLHSF